MTYLERVDGLQRRRHRRVLLFAAAALAAVLLLAGGATWLATRDSGPTATAASGPVQASAVTAGPAPSASPSAAGSPSATAAINDPDGQAACDKVWAWSAKRDGYDVGMLRPIGEQAAKSTNDSIRRAGLLLVDRAKLAVAGKGTDGEFSTTLNMGTAAIDLSTQCLKQGYTKP